MSAIEATHDLGWSFRRKAARLAAARVAMLSVVAFAVALLSASPAFAGQSATGKLAFHPCTQCHPVTVDEAGNPSHPLPIGLKKHEIELEVHDILGESDAACRVCHDDPSSLNPGMLILSDGSLVDITGDVSRVCQRCHFEKYRDWQAGVHGNDAPKCTASGCHDPHTPSWIYVGALPPFQGTGIEVNAVGADRQPFKPMAGPPVPPPVVTPLWFTIAVSIGLVISVGLVGSMIRGRSRR